MQFDFYERYKDYPDTELLKIIQQPDAYQPTAVDAASRILKERGVKEEKANSVHLLDSFEITEQAKMPKLLVFFLLLLALQYLWTCYSTANTLLRGEITRYTYLILVSFLPLAYNGFVFYLLLKRRSWGWILLFINTAIALITRMMQLDILFRYTGLDTTPGILFIIVTLLYLFLTIYLWQKEVLTFFNVSKEAKFWSIVVAICILAAIVIYRFSSGLRGF